MSDELKAVIGGIVIGVLCTLCIWWLVVGVSAATPADLLEEQEPGVSINDTPEEPQEEPPAEETPPAVAEEEQPQEQPPELLPQETPPEEPAPPLEEVPYEYDGPSDGLAELASEGGEQPEGTQQPEDQEFKDFVAMSFGTILGGISGLAVTNKWNVGR
jgi:hypothetical protein